MGRIPPPLPPPAPKSTKPAQLVLRKIQFLDFDHWDQSSYSPPTRTALINTDELVSGVLFWVKNLERHVKLLYRLCMKAAIGRHIIKS